MGKNKNRVGNRRRGIEIPISHAETAALMRRMHEELMHLRRQFEYQRRMIWAIIHERGGRLEIDADGFKACLEGPDIDYVFKREWSADQKTVYLLECDEKGEPVSKIISPDQTKPSIIQPP